MRPTTSTMLQQNNNNNYPCLNVSGSTREMLQKCSRASLPFPSRLEMGLGDLPLIRGLRAWALCSKNRRKPGGLLGGGQAPTAPPASRRGSTSCPRPADVSLSEEWGRMGYGLPLGLDAGQAGIGALVTVATLKPSEGSGKTQTQCLFLQTEKGSCLYSTAKPGSSVVGGWLRGKTGGGGGGSRDPPGGRRDHGPTLPAQTGANRVRVRSGRRWRKSCNAAGREKPGVSRETQQSSRKDPAGEITLEERQEEPDKGGPDRKQFPSPQQDIRRARQEKEGAFRSPRCCQNASHKTCAQCGRRAQRRESQDEQEGGKSPRGGAPNRLDNEVKGMRKEKQQNEEEGKGGLCDLDSSDSVLAVLNPDLKSNHNHSGCDVEEIREAEGNEETTTQTSHSKDDYSERAEDTQSEVMKIHTCDTIRGHSEPVSEDFTSSPSRDFDHRKPSDNPGEEKLANVHGSEKDVESVEENVNPVEDISVSTCPAAPVEGSTCNADQSCVLREQEKSNGDHLEWHQQGVADCGVVGPEEVDVSRFEQQEPNCVADTVGKKRGALFFLRNVENDPLEESNAPSAALRLGDCSIFEADGSIITENGCNDSTIEPNGAGRRDELVWESREEESREENIEQRVNPEEAAEIWRRCAPCKEPDDSDDEGDGKEGNTEGDINGYIIQEEEDDKEEICAPKDKWRFEETAGGCRGWREGDGHTFGQTITDVGADEETSTNVAHAGPSTSPALSLANPAPSLPPLGSMATGLPCLEAEKEEEGVGVTAGDGGQAGKRRNKRELEEQGEEERGSTVAAEEGSKEEEEEEDEFGVFMQADGEPAWSEGSTMSASVPCGSRASVALEKSHAISAESFNWTPGWTDSSSHQSDDAWTAFPQDSSDERRDAVGQWWPTGAVEEGRDGLLTNQNLASVFAAAFPSLPGSSSSGPCDPETVPTLTQLLRDKASQDQGLLDSFHDLNKMICQRYKRANGVSRDQLVRTLHLEPAHAESRPAPRSASRRLSPGLPSANQCAQNAAAKRRLSYDYNRNIME